MNFHAERVQRPPLQPSGHPCSTRAKSPEFPGRAINRTGVRFRLLLPETCCVEARRACCLTSPSRLPPLPFTAVTSAAAPNITTSIANLAADASGPSGSRCRQSEQAAIVDSASALAKQTGTPRSRTVDAKGRLPAPARGYAKAAFSRRVVTEIPTDEPFHALLAPALRMGRNSTSPAPRRRGRPSSRPHRIEELSRAG